MEPEYIIAIFVIVAVAFRLLAGGMDEGRVKAYVEARGGRFLSSAWAPFGKGWFGEKSDRIYEVRYLDSEGNAHHAHCKTSMFTGVYFTEDRIVRGGGRPPDEGGEKARISELERENRRLRDELARTKGRNA